VKPALLLAITKHEFNPGQLFKINPQLKDWPKDTHLQLSEAGILIKAERDMSPKEYPSSGPYTTPSTPTSTFSCTSSSHWHPASPHAIHPQLVQALPQYEWPQVLEYHFKFHNHCIVEMQEGVYCSWEHVDANLMSLHLFSHPKARPAKQNTQPAWSGLKDMSNNSVTCSHMENAHPNPSQATCTSVGSAIHWTMGPVCAQKLIRMEAG